MQISNRMMDTKIISITCAISLALGGQAFSQRAIQPADIYRMKTVSDCRPAPDGASIAYTLTTVDSAKDKMLSHIWMTSWDGQSQLQLTNGKSGEESPGFSPDGKYLSFVSERNQNDDDKDDKAPASSRLWILDRRGGEATQLLETKGALEEYTWSPDSKKIILVIKEPDYSDTSKSRKRKPFVMDRYRFKADIEGYLGTQNTHLYLFDLATKKTDTLTRGNFSESSAVWNPDNNRIAFVSNRTDDPDRNANTDIWLTDTTAATPVQLTHWKGPDTKPAWSPDGRWIAYLQANTEDSFTIYDQNTLALISAQGGTPRILGEKLDRPVSDPKWSVDGNSIAVLVTDDRRSWPAAFSVRDGSMTKLATGDWSISQLESNHHGDWTAIISDPQTPAEIFTIHDGKTHRLTHQQDSYLTPLKLAKVKGFESKSSDGNITGGILYTPADKKEEHLPLILFIHGGPSYQDEYAFDLERQTLAAAGFAVAAVNYRGSNGRGASYCNCIRADWGNREVKDILGAADYLVNAGIVDSTRMGIAGWSYGGILTDYTIASTTRFRAASSGAGSALQLSMYGTDEYVNQYDNELGSPWTNPQKWVALSYPFFKADRIKTPTLFMASQSDFNVPAAGAEQMYQALKTLHIPTRLVIYPGQFHELTVPSYQADRLERWIEWFKYYLTR